MPLPSRDYAAYVSDAGLRDRALEVLLRDDLAHIVDLVCWRDGADVHVADSTGHSALTADGIVTVLAGVDPVADQDPLSDTSYPFAAARLHSLFSDPRAPDLAVVHTDAHHWPERGGHLGEHGSLGAVQSRAPLILSGAGVTARGVLDRAVRTVDVGATLSALAGGSVDGHGRHAHRPGDRDGRRRSSGLLWDGAQCASLLAHAACAARGHSLAVARAWRCGAGRSPSSRRSRWSTTPAH